MASLHLNSTPRNPFFSSFSGAFSAKMSEIIQIEDRLGPSCVVGRVSTWINKCLSSDDVQLALSASEMQIILATALPLWAPIVTPLLATTEMSLPAATIALSFLPPIAGKCSWVRAALTYGKGYQLMH